MKKAIAIILSAIIILALAASCGSPERPLSVPELLDLGEKYLLEMNYEQALVQFLRVIEIEPMNPRGYTGAAEAYVGLGDTENAVAILRQGAQRLPDNAEIQGALGRLDAPGQESQEGEAGVGREPEDEQSREVNRFLSELNALYDADGWESVLEMMDTDAFRELLALIDEYPFIMLNDAGDYGIGMYHDGRCIYIGEYADMQRSGRGVWIYSFTGTFYDCEWKDDSPNGMGTYESIRGNVGAGTLVDGLWHGPVTDGDHSLEFIHGKVVVIEERENGSYTVGTRIDGEGTLGWDEILVNGTHGVLPFSEMG